MPRSFILVAAYLALTTAQDVVTGEGDCVARLWDPESGRRDGHLPVLLTTGRKQREFVYPEDKRAIIRVPTGKSIYLACPGHGNYLETERKPSETVARCVSDGTFNVDGVNRDFSSLTCRYQPEHTSKRTGRLCLDAYQTVLIGFQLKTAFVELIEVCRDQDSYSTLYTKFQMTKWIGNYQRNVPRPFKWSTGEFFPGVDVTAAYKAITQRDTIAGILGSRKIANEKIKPPVQLMSRGHMAARADFVHGAQQVATFWYINAAPQWQSFNGGNWMILEENVRKLASSRRLDLLVYTGVHDLMTMEDVQGRQQPIHLHRSSAGRYLPAPKFYWKIVYDPVTKRGTAFVGLNDPFLKNVTRDVYLCDDVSPTISWLTWNPKSVWHGLSYACTVSDLRKAVPNVPALNAVGILR